MGVFYHTTIVRRWRPYICNLFATAESLMLCFSFCVHRSEHRFASTEEEDAANVHQLNAIDNHNTYELYLVENK